MKESEGNMFNPIFKDNVQGRKLPGCTSSGVLIFITIVVITFVIEMTDNFIENSLIVHV